MNLKFNTAIAVTAIVALSSPTALAVPAKPGIIKYATAEGDSISVYLRGDERNHFFTTTDGYLLTRHADNTFRYAVPVGNTLVESTKLAADPGKRSIDAEALLSSFSKQTAYTLHQSAAKAKPRRGVKAVAPEAGESTFQTKGSPHICIILVEFSDNSFSYNAQTFVDMFNKTGFNEHSATGSVADYFKASSNGQFTPTLDVLGPVKLSKTMSYYGGNNRYGDDQAPEQMVIDACAMLDSSVDFSVYDTDNDGVIDNVYVVYAGYGEAQGAPDETIWPHSWAVQSGAGKTKYLDGKLLDHYATSNELNGTSGTDLDGIGTFCHEFSHVMGLPDLYATTYTSSFTPGEYSLMDYGSYNNDSHTPPTHSAYERYCLGWIDPEVLESPEIVTIRSISDQGGYNSSRIIKTGKTNEYFVLENRQQTGWDKYIPGHGMLVWHIDYDPSVWRENVCNNTPSHQYIDIEEADGKQSEYNRNGDTFPGSSKVTSFTDETNPSMKTWAGESLNSPITDIKEENGVITFSFKGGKDIFDAITAQTPSTDDNTLTPIGFTARWNKVDKATGYLLNVYTRAESNGKETYLEGYERKNVGDVDRFEVTGLTPESTYYYTVQATDGNNISAKSNEVTVETPAPTFEYKAVEALDATSISAGSFSANWPALDEADGYKVTLYNVTLGQPDIDNADFTDSKIPTGWLTFGTDYVTSERSYATTLPSLRLRINNAYIMSAKYDDYVRSISFWSRTLTENANNRIKISGFVNDQWIDIDTVQLTTTGKIYGTGDIPAECTTIMLTYVREQGQAVIDDVYVGHGGKLIADPVEASTDIDAGDVTSHTFTDLQPETTYGYTIKAYNAAGESLPSKMITVRTTSASGAVDDMTIGNDGTAAVTTDGNTVVVRSAADTTVSISELSGRIIVTTGIKAGQWISPQLQPGIYIVTTGRNHHKTVIR